MVLAENLRDQAEVEPAKSSAPPSGRVSESPEWQLVQRIVASSAFTRSRLLTNFLLYVCDRKLQGREDEITEHQIGVHAVGRPANYHPGEDNIVRNYARILRKRLEEYFEHEGKCETLRIVIPRGQYVPIFEAVRRIEEPAPSLLPSAAVAPEDLQTVRAVEIEPAAGQTLHRRKFLISASMAVAAASFGWFGFHENEKTLPERLFHGFWAQIFNPNRDSFIVTGDDGLVLLERMTGEDISLNNYVNGKATSAFREFVSASPFAKEAFGMGPLPHSTSTADLSIAIALDRLAMAVHVTPMVRNARGMQMSEIKRSNCIFIGGPRSNPWVELFDPNSNFQMKYLPVSSNHAACESIWNKRPKPGEQEVYMNSPAGTYTAVSFLPSMDGEGWVLLLDGEIIPGTEAAGDFVTNMKTVAPVLNRARRSDGSIGPFELILETQAVGADAREARIVVERYGTFKD